MTKNENFMWNFHQCKLVLYALLALIGLSVTWYENVLFMLEHQGFSAFQYIEENYVNHASASIFNDLISASMTFLIWSFFESKRLGMRYLWAIVILNFFVSFAFAFPLFLLLREREMHGNRESLHG